MNWSWPGRQGSSTLTDNATNAESRLKAIKKSLKALRKGIEESLRTSNSRNRCEDIETRKKRCNEYILGESTASAVHMLSEEKGICPSSFVSPLNTIMERYANFEKTIGHMLAANEMEIASFLTSDTPIAKLLDKEIPSVQCSKKDLDQAMKRHQSAQSSLDKETRKLEKMRQQQQQEDEEKIGNLEESIHMQEEKRDRLAHEVENLAKEVNMEHDKLTSTLLTLVSRENRYASSILDLMRIKKQFYENAFNVIAAELPNIERILNETHVRPVFGERLEDHLQTTGRVIAQPIRLAITVIRKNGLNDEGLFRISPKAIKLDKVKAFMDANIPYQDSLLEEDIHLHCGLLKSYLRELPEPLMCDKKAKVYSEWLDVLLLRDNSRVKVIQRILYEELSPMVIFNLQYLIKFLHEVSKNSQTTKMTPHNIAIVFGPNLLWSNSHGSLSEQNNIERVIAVVTYLIENYNIIFKTDLSWEEFDDKNLKQKLGNTELHQNEYLSPTDARDDRSLRPASTNLECSSPMHKRSNIFKTKFLSKSSSPKSEEGATSLAPTVQLNAM